MVTLLRDHASDTDAPFGINAVMCRLRCRPPASRRRSMRTPYGYRKRLKHYDEASHAHYLPFSCFRNLPFLRSERACGWFIEAVLDAKRRHRFDLWAWVIMLNHVHLLLQPGAGVSVRNLLKAIKEPVSKRASAWVRYHAPEFLPRMLDVQPSGRQCVRFWQPGGGYDRNIISAAEVWEKITYIHNNPVRKGLVENPVDWKWSSCAAWEGGVDEPLPIDRVSVPPLRG
jgi:putative transposase